MAEPSSNKEKEKRRGGLPLPWAEAAEGAARPAFWRQLTAPVESFWAWLKGLPALGPAGAARALASAGGRLLVYLVPFAAAGYLAVHFADRMTQSPRKARGVFRHQQGSVADAERSITNEGLGVAGVYTQAEAPPRGESPLPLPESGGSDEEEPPAQPPPRPTPPAGPPLDPGPLAPPQDGSPQAKLQRLQSLSEQSGGTSQASFGQPGGASGDPSRSASRGGAAADAGGAGGGARAAGRARLGRVGGRAPGGPGAERRAVRQLLTARSLSQKGLSGTTERGSSYAAAAFDGHAITGPGASVGPGGAGTMGAPSGAGGGGMGAGAGGGDALEGRLDEAGSGPGGECDPSKQRNLKRQFEDADVTPYQEDLDRARELASEALSKRNQALFMILGGLAALVIGLRMLGRAVKAGKIMSEAALGTTKAATLGAGALAGTIGGLKAKGATPKLSPPGSQNDEPGPEGEDRP